MALTPNGSLFQEHQLPNHDRDLEEDERNAYKFCPCSGPDSVHSLPTGRNCFGTFRSRMLMEERKGTFSSKRKQAWSLDPTNRPDDSEENQDQTIYSSHTAIVGSPDALWRFNGGKATTPSSELDEEHPPIGALNLDEVRFKLAYGLPDRVCRSDPISVSSTLAQDTSKSAFRDSGYKTSPDDTIIESDDQENKENTLDEDIMFQIDLDDAEGFKPDEDKGGKALAPIES